MKQFFCLIAAFCLVIFAASAAGAQDYRTILTQGGVEVMVALDPLGPNNQIEAYVKFVNLNGYKVNITWTPFITCERGPAKKGYGTPFSMNATSSYEARLWRSAACMVGSIKDLKVDMEVSAAASAK
jgi:hypothetical protein